MPETDNTSELEGRTTVDGMVFECERLSYRSATEAAEQIVKKVVEKADKDRPVLITDWELLGDAAALRSAYVSLDLLAKDYEALAASIAGADDDQLMGFMKESGGSTNKSLVADGFIAASAIGLSAVNPVSAAVNAALGVVGLFRHDVEYHGQKTTIEQLPVEIAVAARLKAHGLDPLVPALSVSVTTASSKQSLRWRLEQVEGKKALVWNRMAPTIRTLVQLEAQLDDAIAKDNKKEADRLRAEVFRLRSELQPVSDSLTSLDQRYGSLMSVWNEAGEGKISQFSRILWAEVLLAKKPTCLFVKVLSSGGHTRTIRTLFRTLFTGDGLSFSGGTVICWALFQSDGEFIDGGILDAKCGSNF